MTLRPIVLLLFAMLSLSACQSATQKLGNPELPYPPVKQPQVGDILHLPTGIYVDQQVMLDQAVRTQVVFVGETHDNPASHRLQVNILKALQQNNPGRISLAMEMFSPSQQPVLNRWVAGELSEKEFIKQVDWYSHWNMNFAFYRELLTFCRDNQIPVLALNSEKELKQKVGRTPFDQLTDEEKKQLPQMDHNDPYQQAMVKAVFPITKWGRP